MRCERKDRGGVACIPDIMHLMENKRYTHRLTKFMLTKGSNYMFEISNVVKATATASVKIYLL